VHVAGLQTSPVQVGHNCHLQTCLHTWLQGGDSDYINASMLQSKSGELPAWSYIATQVRGVLRPCQSRSRLPGFLEKGLRCRV